MDVMLAPERLLALWRVRRRIAAMSILGAIVALGLLALTVRFEPFTSSVEIGFRSGAPKEQRETVGDVLRSRTVEAAVVERLGEGLPRDLRGPGELIKRIQTREARPLNWVERVLLQDAEQVIEITVRASDPIVAQQVAQVWAEQTVTLANLVIAGRDYPQIEIEARLEARLEANRLSYLEADRRYEAFVASPEYEAVQRRVQGGEQLMGDLSQARTLVVARAAENARAPGGVSAALSAFEAETVEIIRTARAEVEASRQERLANTLRLSELAVARDSARAAYQATNAEAARLARQAVTAAAVRLAADADVAERRGLSFRMGALAVAAGGLLSGSIAALVLLVGKGVARSDGRSQDLVAPAGQPAASVSR